MASGRGFVCCSMWHRRNEQKKVNLFCVEESKMPSLWTRSYFVSTAGNVCSETIKKYVESQKKRY